MTPVRARTVERSFGFGHVRSTAALAAPWFVGAALDGVALADLGVRLRVVGPYEDLLALLRRSEQQGREPAGGARRS